MLSDRDQRRNRGQNMAALIADAAEQGDTFWRNDDWAEDEPASDDSSFEEENVKPDVFDSDFMDSEDDNDSDDESSGGEDREGESSKRQVIIRSTCTFRYLVIIYYTHAIK
jgi:hypothetical protein